MQFARNPSASTFFGVYSASQCRVSFCCTARWINSSYTEISLLDVLPIQDPGEHCLEFPALHSRFHQLHILNTASLLHICQPNFPRPPLPLGTAALFLHLCLHSLFIKETIVSIEHAGYPTKDELATGVWVYHGAHCFALHECTCPLYARAPLL